MKLHEVSKGLTITNHMPFPAALVLIQATWDALTEDERTAFEEVADTYDDIVVRCCDAWNFFANDPERVCSISDREYAKTVKL